jgi:hypothetical protein
MMPKSCPRESGEMPVFGKGGIAISCVGDQTLELPLQPNHWRIKILATSVARHMEEC